VIRIGGRSRDRIALVGCAATVAFAVLAFGGAVRWAAIAASAGAIAAAIPYAISRRPTARRSPLMILLGIAIGWTALQLIPLPACVAHVIAGAKLELVADNAAALGDPSPAWVAASYDPPATLVELAKLCGYAALAFATARLADRRSGGRALAMVVVAAAVLVAVVALIHEALGADAIYGIFASPTGLRLISPIINDNHFASLMALGAPMALGLVVSSARASRLIWVLAAVLCAGANLAISSRGGAIGLVVGSVVAITMIVVQRRTRDPDVAERTRTGISVVVIATCVVVLLGALTARHVLAELLDIRVSDELADPYYKVQAWVHAIAMLGDNPILGTGRGAFEQAFTRWSGLGTITYSHVENSYLQLFVDWGILGAATIALAGSLVAVSALRRWRHGPIEAGAVGALAALAVHELVDFSLELPAIAMLVIIALSILVPAQLGTTRAGVPAVRCGFLVVAAIVCALAATPWGRSARDTVFEANGPPVPLLAGVRAVSDRHPADYLWMGRVGQVLIELRDARGPAVISRALFLNPYHGGLHRVAARMLAQSQRPQQARVEYALAVAFGNEINDTIEEIATAFPQPAEAARALPIDGKRASRIVAVLFAQRRDLIAFEYTSQLAMSNPGDPDVQLLTARAAIATNHREIAAAAAREAYRLRPDSRAALVLGRAMALAGDSAGARATMRTALSAVVLAQPREHAELLSAIVDVEIDSGALDDAARSLDELAHVVIDTDGLILLHLQRARLDDRLGDVNQSVWEREEVRKLRQRNKL
jgi:hypothetical protein